MRALDPGATEVSGGSADTGDRPVPARGQTIDRFVVVGMLGAGGMGLVLAAYDPDLDRKVALKLLHPGAAPEHATRLLREAQAMAKLAHANVITVYEVGTVGDQIFIAMELVDGGTLGERVKHATGWQDLVRLFACAGEGLAAAHDAGMVHRDFKPDNVLVGHDGRVRVSDFGLVGTPDEATERAAGPPQGDVTLTRTGTILGTPAYMAPEQWAGQPVDARSDQFSFAVALYEALYGTRPFAGATAEARIASMKAGPAAPPAGSRVPIRIHRVILRALQVEAAARYPTMRALLDQLAVDPRRRWRRGAAVVGALGVVGLATVLTVRPGGAPTVCTGFETRLGNVWDPTRSQQLHATFVATGEPSAEDAWRGAAAALDDYTGRWVAMRVEACEATQVRGEQSAELMDLRMGCLDQRLGEVSALVETLGRVDGLGFRPVAVGPLPPVLERLVLPHCRVQLMTLEAGLKGDRELALQALMMDPQCSHLPADRVRRLGLELLSATSQWLPQF